MTGGGHDAVPRDQSPDGVFDAGGFHDEPEADIEGVDEPDRLCELVRNVLRRWVGNEVETYAIEIETIAKHQFPKVELFVLE